MELKYEMSREVQPKEVLNLIFGTGALSWEWWHEFYVERDGKRLDQVDDSDLLATDILVFSADYPDEPEGNPPGLFEITPQQVVDAVAEAVKRGVIGQEDLQDVLTEDIGYCDAIEADNVLQLAVYNDIVFG